MSIWYAICDWLPIEMLHWDFMKNAFLAILLMAPLFGLMSTMIVTGRMSFFSDALGHSAFTGIAIGCICGAAAPTWVAVLFSAAVFLRPQPLQSGSGYPDRRLFQRCSGSWHLHRHHGRRQLYQI